MNLPELKVNVDRALKFLQKNDIYLLQKDVSERTICHKLAEYLQMQFIEFNVDCEYNRTVNGDTKSIKALKSQIVNKIRTLADDERMILNEELHDYRVSPDIVIHSRGTNKNNLCILEIKKSGRSTEWDEQKLCAYTLPDLSYAYGVLIVIDAAGDSALRVFQNGCEVS